MKVTIISAILFLLFSLFGCKETSQKNDSYMIKEYHNAVMVYKNDRPYRKTDIVLSSLPVEEILKIKKGIHANDYEEVEKIIEMYAS